MPTLKYTNVSRRQLATGGCAFALTWLGLPFMLKASAQAGPSIVAGAEPLPDLASRATLVNNVKALKAEISKARPGDKILMADGDWRDTEIKLSAIGTQQAPIHLAAQTPGAVILSGSSQLTLSGAYLIASGLVFRNGATPAEVIEFGSKNGVTHHCRVTRCTIESYNAADSEKSNWVTMSGRFNRFDHNYIAGKTNQGVSVAVVLNKEKSDNNFHSIDHNHFGPRPELGTNGGETIRVGTGKFLHHVSSTRIENNLFEECNGEAEIISLKTAGNKVKDNLFLRCAGAVTIRQGRQNTIEDNIFLGEGAPATGGVRITGRDQIVRNNLFVGLRGDGNRSALTLMNGAPGQDKGTYAPIVGAVIENNSFFNVSKLTFGSRADDVLSQAPQHTVFRNNLLVGTSASLFEIESSLGGIAFENNAVFGKKAKGMAQGFSFLEQAIEPPTEATGYRSPDVSSGIGFRPSKGFITRADVGPSYDLKE